MTSTDLVAFERVLRPLAPNFEEVLKPLGVPAERIIRTMLVSHERNPDLFNCTAESRINAAMSAACLGIEVDGVTGQGFLLPFKHSKTNSKRAQLVVGYKGYNTMGGRSGFTINGAVVREGDEFDYEMGTRAYIHHKPKIGDEGRRIVAAWAIGQKPGFAPIVPEPISIQEIEAVKARSPGGTKGDSPWNDPKVGFPAMAAKTAKRRLARAMPLNLMVMAAAMDETFEERGVGCHIDPGRGVVLETGDVLPQRQTIDEPKPLDLKVTLNDGSWREPKTIEEWEAFMRRAIAEAPLGRLDKFMQINNERAVALREAGHGDAVNRVQQDYERRKSEQGGGGR